MMIEWILLLLLIGLVAGTVGSLVGLGGGIIIVPSLLVLASFHPGFSGITPPVAVGTSLILIVLTACSSTLTYSKQKRVDFHSGWLFFITCGPGAMVGAYLTRYFHSDWFFVGFGFIMILVSLMLTIREKVKHARPMNWDVTRTFQDESGETYEFGYHRLTALVVSFFVGMVSGLFGIGGGALLMPMMIILFRYPPHMATATSMFTIFLSSVTGSFTHLVQGNIHWLAAAFLAPGAWAGGRLGAWISSRLSNRALLICLRIALVLVAIRMILKGLHII